MNICGDRRVFIKKAECVCWRAHRQGRCFRAGDDSDEQVFIPTAHTQMSEGFSLGLRL